MTRYKISPGEVCQHVFIFINLGIRPKVWKYLLKYVLINDAEKILIKKRAEYRKLLNNYWRPDSFTEDEKKIYHTINVDVKRIGSDFTIVCKS